MIRGTAVWIDLSDASPPEMGRRRPAVIVSNSIQDMVLDSIVVVPLSSRPPEIPHLRIGSGYLARRTRALRYSRHPASPEEPNPPRDWKIGHAELTSVSAAIGEYLSD